MSGHYSNFPTVAHTLDDFNFRLNSMYEDDKYDAFLRASLTGAFTDDEGQKKQIFIDPIQDLVQDDHELTLKRDYDSLIGISNDVLTTATINAHAVPPGTLCLKSSIHIKYPMPTANGHVQVEYHHIPNFEFGSFGPRCQLLFFFPGLWSKERAEYCAPYQLAERELSLWYESALRPAVVKLLGGRTASEWPPSYDAEIIRGQNNSGTHSRSSRMVASWAAPLLAHYIRQAVDDYPFPDPADSVWARSFFLMHIVRGVKHITSHDVWEGTHYLERVFEEANLSRTAHIDGEWWVDVGLEVSSDRGDCLQWMTSSHRHIVREVLGISDDYAKRVTRISYGPYYRDLSSHLTAVSGFRLTLNRRTKGPFDAVYMQMYTTDKSAVYNPDGRHHAKFVTSKQALGTTQPPTIIEGLHTIYERSRDTNSSKARLELRVPYRYADAVLVDVDEARLRSSICAFSRETWWNFRLIRLMGISQTFSLQESGPSHLRFMEESLLLTAACLWLVNGLHARPEDGPAARDLMRAVLPITEDRDAILEYLAYNSRVAWEEDEDDGSDADEEQMDIGVPYNPYGCVFLRSIVLQGDGALAPRFWVGGRNISPRSFEFWFQGMDKERIKALYQKTGILSREATRSIRLTTNKKSLVRYVNRTGAPEPVLFQLEVQGFSLPTPDLGQAIDVIGRSSPPVADPAQHLDELISRLWRQFVMDLSSKSPNPRGITKASYVRLTKAQRLSGNDAPYRTLYLPEVFNAVWYKNASRSQWQTCFNWLLPEPGRRASASTQNYSTCIYYREWMVMLDEHGGNPGLIDSVRNFFWRRIREWSWIPHAQSDKMWPTTAIKPRGGDFDRWPPAAPGTAPAAPRILLHSTGIPILRDLDHDMEAGLLSNA